MQTEFWSGKMKMLWRWMLVVVVQHCECVTATELDT